MVVLEKQGRRAGMDQQRVVAGGRKGLGAALLDHLEVCGEEAGPGFRCGLGGR